MKTLNISANFDQVGKSVSVQTRRLVKVVEVDGHEFTLDFDRRQRRYILTAFKGRRITQVAEFIRTYGDYLITALNACFGNEVAVAGHVYSINH